MSVALALVIAVAAAAASFALQNWLRSAAGEGAPAGPPFRSVPFPAAQHCNAFAANDFECYFRSFESEFDSPLRLALGRRARRRRLALAALAASNLQTPPKATD